MYISPSLLATASQSPAAALNAASAPLVLLEFPSTASANRLDLNVSLQVLRDATTSIVSHSKSISAACLTLSSPVRHLTAVLPRTVHVVDGFSPDGVGDDIRAARGPDGVVESIARAFGSCAGDWVGAARGKGDEDVSDGKSDKDGERWVFILHGMEVAGRGESVAWVANLLWQLGGGRVACVVGAWNGASVGHDNSSDDGRVCGLRRLATSRIVAKQDSSGRVVVESTRVRESGRVGFGKRVADFGGGKCGSVLSFQDYEDEAAHGYEQYRRKGPDEEAFQGMERLGLSFRVGLTEAERLARSKVEISYVHKDPQKADEGLVLHPGALAIGEERESDEEEDDGEEYEEAEDV